MKKNIHVILILSILLSFISGSIGGYLIIINTSSSKSDDKIITNNTFLEEVDSLSNAVSYVYDAVVVVEGYTQGQLTSTGTGFIYKNDGKKAYIMTNHHVISGAENVKVILSDNKVIDVDIKGSEAYSDIAVLSMPANSVKKTAVMGDSTKLKVGDSVFTVGSPEGSSYAGTVTRGVLSGKDRLVAVALENSNTSDYYMKVLQTDAAINPGNSGGPLCNINGEVIGITNMKLVDSTVEGIGFAIPIEDALRYAEILENGKEITRPYFGIGMLDVTDSFNLWQNRITIDEDITKGVVILEVASSSPASRAKLQKGDVIISLGGEDVSSVAEFRYILYKHNPKEEVVVKYIRDGKEKTTKVKLTENNS